jgi:hypothetical protein
MPKLAVLSTGWAAFFHSTSNEVHHSLFLLLFLVDHCTFFLGFVLDYFFPGPDFTHRYPTHLPTIIRILPTLVPY